MVRVLVSYVDRPLETHAMLMEALENASDALNHLLDLARLDSMSRDDLIAFTKKHDKILEDVDTSADADSIRAEIKTTLNVKSP